MSLFSTKSMVVENKCRKKIICNLNNDLKIKRFLDIVQIQSQDSFLNLADFNLINNNHKN